MLAFEKRVRPPWRIWDTKPYFIMALILFSIPCLISLILAGNGFFEIVKGFFFVRETVSVNALVENYYDSGKGVKEFDAQVLFQTQTGEPVQASVLFRYETPRIGQILEIRYYPNNPRLARYAGELWTDGLYYLLFGAFFVVIMGAIYLFCVGCNWLTLKLNRRNRQL
jgi:hypothetical protein